MSNENEIKNESPEVTPVQKKKGGRPKGSNKHKVKVVKEEHPSLIEVVAETNAALETPKIQVLSAKVTIELTAEEKVELHKRKKAERERSMRDRDVLNLSEKTLEKLQREGKVAKLAKKELIPMWKSRGYEILEGAEHESSDEVYASRSASGGIEIQDNKSDPLSKSVWMVTDIENREILREIEADKAKKQQDMVGSNKVTIDGVTENLLPGKLTKY